MRKYIVLACILLVLLVVSSAYSQGHGMMRGGQGWNYCPYCGQYLGPSGGGYGLEGHGMMGRMGPGMMWGGYGMEPGMMSPGYLKQNEQCQNFFDETANLRKDLHNKRYEYFEAIRNPKSTTESIAKLEKEIRDIQGKVHAKAPQGCWWQ